MNILVLTVLKSQHKALNVQSVHVDEDNQIINLQVEEGNQIQNCDIPFDIGNQPEQNVEAMPHDSEVITLFELKEMVYKSILRFSSNLYGCSTLNRQHVQTVIEKLQSLWCPDFLKHLKDKVFLMLRNINQTEENLDELKSMFSIYENLFSGLESDFLRMKALGDSGCFIKPKSYIIGSENKFKIVHEIPVPTPVECYGQYVPMSDMLKTVTVKHCS